MALRLWWQHMRLAKFLAGAGVASRRAAEEIIRDGRVTVDGAVIVDPAFGVEPDPALTVAVDGAPVALQEGSGLVVYAVNKPIGVVSTASDPQGRRTVVSLIKTGLRLYPVGRLDADTTGLILLTNDGALAYRLTHPSFEVDKTYRAVVRKPPVRERELRALRSGVELDDGRTAPARVTLAAPDTLMLTIHEGRKRQVKRMCAAVGHPVVSLTRVRFGPLTLGDLAPGQYRRLSAAEVSLLRSAGSGDRRDPASSRSGRQPSRPGSRSAGGSPPAARR
jgi:23S rRNA pseudouridine2605 synthase